MILQSNLKEIKEKKFNFPEEKILTLSKKVFSGTEQRKTNFEKYLRYYYEGSDQVSETKLKRLFGEINTILSLIFTPESLILEPICNEKLNDIQYEILNALVKEIYDNFVTYNRLDLEIEEAILHALILGYTPLKVYWQGNGVLYREINPANFGILYESLDLDDPQQIIGHKTYMTKEKIQYLYGIDVEKEVAIKEKAVKKSYLTELIATSKTRSVVTVYPEAAAEDYKYWVALDVENLIEVIELWINEKYETGNDIWHKYVIIPKLDLVVKHEIWKGLRHPFFLLVLYPAYGSCLGISLIELIKEIQAKRIENLEKIDHLTDLRTYPPVFIRGAAVSPDQLREDIKNLYQPGGYLLIQDERADFTPFPPQTGLPELYEQMEYWNEQLKFITGLYEIVLGETTRTRAARGLQILATFATSIFRKIAHRIETTLEDIFTYTAYLYQYNSDKDIVINNKRYKFSDFPYDYRIRIKSHTASPIDVGQIKELFLLMYRMGDIPADMLFDLYNLPFRQSYEKYKEKKAALALMALEKEKKEEKKKK